MKSIIFNQHQVNYALKNKEGMFRVVVKSKYSASESAPFNVGETIFVKEAFFINQFKDLMYKATFSYCGKKFPKLSNILSDKTASWKSPVHMKQEHSRLTLRIKSVKVERLQDISESDVMKEGCFLTQDDMGQPIFGFCKEEVDQELGYRKAQDAYRVYWNSTHKKPEEKWEASPWVWCYECEVVR